MLVPTTATALAADADGGAHTVGREARRLSVTPTTSAPIGSDATAIGAASFASLACPGMAVAASRTDPPRSRGLSRESTGSPAITRDGFGRRLVAVRPARELVQIVADARDLADALALDGQGGRGPCPRPRHCLPKQRGGGDTRRRRLLPPSGMLRRRDAGGDHHGAALRHGRTGGGVRGAVSRARLLIPKRRAKAGVQGGRSVPFARPQCSNTASAGSLALAASDKPVADVSETRRRPPPMRWGSTPASAPGNPFNGPREARSPAGWRPAIPGRQVENGANPDRESSNYLTGLHDLHSLSLHRI